MFVPSLFAVCFLTRSQAVARIADRTAKNCRGHVTGSRDLGYAHFQGNLFVRLLGIPNTKPPTKFDVSSSSSFGDIFDRIPKIVGSRDLGHAHIQGKLFVRPLCIPDTKLHTKFEVSSSSSF